MKDYKEANRKYGTSSEEAWEPQEALLGPVGTAGNQAQFGRKGIYQARASCPPNPDLCAGRGETIMLKARWPGAEGQSVQLQPVRGRKEKGLLLS